jgi:hypothetical protein
MLEPFVEVQGTRILSQSQHLATADLGRPTGPGDNQKPQWPHAAKQLL